MCAGLRRSRSTVKAVEAALLAGGSCRESVEKRNTVRAVEAAVLAGGVV